MKTFTDQSGGVIINHQWQAPPRRRELPRDCPIWATPHEADQWREKGVVVWDEGAHRLERLSARRALTVIERMHATTEWKVAGLAITRIVTRIPLSETRLRKRSRRKESPPETLIPETKAEAQTVDDERFRLTPSANAEFLEYLEANEAKLREWADDDAKEEARVLGNVFGILIQAAFRNELAEVDVSARRLPWSRMEDALQLVCNQPPNQGTVTLDKSNLYWRGHIERPDQLKDWSPPFHKLDEALTWVEQEIVKPPMQTSEEEEPLELTAEQLERLRPYRIEPSALEPESISYRVVFDIEVRPLRFKTLELSSGKTITYHEEFAAPTTLARELKIDPNRFEIEQLLGPDVGWFRLTSCVTYYNGQLAMAQAQQLWDQSAIVEQYKVGKLVRAKYAYQEVETGYAATLGVCDSPEKPWGKPESRAEHMARWALRETIYDALDLAAFRSFLRISTRLLTDEKLLEALHEGRAESTYVSQEARLESEQWLKENRRKRQTTL